MLSKLHDVVSVKDFGAVGDGRHDDTDAINNAIKTIEAKGGALRFPAGVYLTSSGITPSTNSPNCVAIVGDGASNTIVRATREMRGVYYRPYGTNQIHCSISDISFDGNSMAKVAFWKAGQPASWYRNIYAYNARPDGSPGADAQVLIGHDTSDKQPGGDYETHITNFQVLQEGLGAIAPYNFKTQQTASDGTYDDVTVWGNTTGTTAGIYQQIGGGNVWTHAHCYPSGRKAAHQPTCILDEGGQSVFNGTEVDGMTGAGITFIAGGSTALGTSFVYGADGEDYSKSVGFKQIGQHFTPNQVFGASCGGSSLTKWTLLATDPDSQSIPAFGPSACTFNAPIVGYNINLKGAMVHGDGSIGNAQLTLRGYTDPSKRLLVGYDTTGDFAWLQSLHNGAPKPLVFNASGGHLLVGKSVDSTHELDVKGDINGTSFYVNGAAGVSCSGRPTASFTVTKGIVTHC